MYEVFSAALSAMLTMFSCMAVGFILRKRRLEPEDTDSVLSKLLNYAICPALTFTTMAQNFSISSISQNYKLVLFSGVLMVSAMLLSGPLSRLFCKEGYTRNVYKYALVFANSGYMGNAIVLALFNTEILYYYLLFTMPQTIGIYTWGMAQLVPGKSGLKGTLLRFLNPNTIALVLGIIVGALGITPYIPGFIDSALVNLGNCLGPIAMVLTGYVVGKYDLKKMLTNKGVYFASLLRLIVLPGLFCAVLVLLGVDRLTTTLALIAFGMPLGLNTVVFPAAYDKDTSIGAGMSLISTVLSVILFPLMYMVFTSLFA